MVNVIALEFTVVPEVEETDIVSRTVERSIFVLGKNNITCYRLLDTEIMDVVDETASHYVNIISQY